MRLFAPQSYLRATPLERSRACNGCGGADSWSAWIVPNHIWGLCIEDACNIHDWEYGHGYGKARADLMLLCNLLMLCGRGSLWLLPLRAVRCLTYYLAVTFFGRRFYGRKLAQKQLRGRGRG